MFINGISIGTSEIVEKRKELASSVTASLLEQAPKEIPEVQQVKANEISDLESQLEALQKEAQELAFKDYTIFKYKGYKHLTEEDTKHLQENTKRLEEVNKEISELRNKLKNKTEASSGVDELESQLEALLEEAEELENKHESELTEQDLTRLVELGKEIEVLGRELEDLENKTEASSGVDELDLEIHNMSSEELNDMLSLLKETVKQEDPDDRIDAMDLLSEIQQEILKRGEPIAAGTSFNHKVKAGNSSPQVYVGTYAKYNSGSIDGAWLNLNDYSNKEEFLKACYELHKDEEDPEIMFQDFEGFPESYYYESSLSDKLWDWLALDDQEKKILEVYLSGMGDKDISIDEVKDRYDGVYDSKSDWAYEFMEDTGGPSPEQTETYFDYEAYARDCELSGDIDFISHDGKVFVFRGNY
jgi:antirestriction protein